MSLPDFSTAPSTSMSARLDAVINQAIAGKKIVGAVVLVAQDGEVLYRRVGGLADREAQTPIREDSIFRLASVTKPIVTATLMRLIEDGALSLDDAVTRWLPDFRPHLPDGTEPEITIRQLLTHTAGLSYRFQEPAESAYRRLDVCDGMDQPGLSLEENLQRLAAAPLLFAPGAGWRYSLSIDVLGGVIEKACGKGLPEAVREAVTGPLGMADADFAVSDRDRLVTPYADGAVEPALMTDGIAVPLFDGAVIFAPSRALDPISYASGGAGMVATAGDILRFLEAIRSGGAPILSQETVATMMTDQVGSQAETQGPGWGFGFGWGVLDDPALTGTPQSKGTIQWGGAYGHSWFIDPDRCLTVVALTNTAFEGMSGAFPVDIRNAVYG